MPKPADDPLATRKAASADSFLADLASWAKDDGAGRPHKAPSDGFPGLTVLEKLGQGQFGAVYKVWNEQLKAEYALKVLLTGPKLQGQARENFLKEARALASIRHPNVLTVHWVLEEPGRIGIVTDLVRGKTLEDWITDNGPLGPEESVQVGVQVCRALAAVHAKGLVHRDVKTENILREEGGRVVLADFGLGIFLEEGQPASAAGSPHFMSPEQVEGGAIDGGSDLYSLGIVLYRLVTGRYPFRGGSLPALFAEKRAGAFRLLRDERPDLPPGFVDVVHKAISNDPALRCQSAGEMEQGLLDCLRSTEERRRAGQRTWTTRWKVIVLACGLLALGVLVSPAFRSGPGFEVEEASLWRFSRLESQRLEPGGEVEVGDVLYLGFQADKDLYVYVINEDDANRRKLLFPRPDVDLRNPLAGGVRHSVPGTAGGKVVGWPIDTEAGRESFFVVASRAPVREMEAEAATHAAEAPLTATAMRGFLRGVGDKLAEIDLEAVAGGKDSLARFIAALRRKQAVGGRWDEIWADEIRLHHR